MYIDFFLMTLFGGIYNIFPPIFLISSSYAPVLFTQKSIWYLFLSRVLKTFIKNVSAPPLSMLLTMQSNLLGSEILSS